MFVVKNFLALISSSLKCSGQPHKERSNGDRSSSYFRALSNLSRQLVASLYLVAICIPLFDASAEVRQVALKNRPLKLAELVNGIKGRSTATLALVNRLNKDLICIIPDEACLKRVLNVGLQGTESLALIPKISVQKTVGKKLQALVKKSKLLKNFKSTSLTGASLATANIANINDLIRSLSSAGITLTPLETVLLAVIVQALSDNQSPSGTVAPMVDKIRGLDPDLAPAQRVTDVAYSGKWVVLDGRFAKSGNEIVSSGVVSGELLFQNESQLLIKLNPGTGLAQFTVKNSAGASSPVSINVVTQPVVTPAPGAPVINTIQGFNPAVTTADRFSATAVSGGLVLLTGSFAASGNELLSTGTVSGTIQNQSSTQITVQLGAGLGTANFAIKNSSGTSLAKSIQVLSPTNTSAPRITKIQGFDATRPVGAQLSDTATSGKEVVLTGNFAATGNELVSTGTVNGIIIKQSTTQINIQLASGTGQAVFAIRNSSGLSAPAQIAVTAGGTVSPTAPVISNIQGYDVKQPIDKRLTATAVAGGVVRLTGTFAAKGNQIVSTGNVPAGSILIESATEIYMGLANVGGTATIAVKNSGGTSAPRSITVTGGSTTTPAPVIQSINGYMQTANGEVQTTQIAYSGGYVLLSGSFLASGNTLLSTGLVSGTLAIETATQIVVKLSPGAGKAQFAIRNSQGTSAPAFITVVFSDAQPTSTPVATATPIITATPVATNTPTTPTGAAPVIRAIAGVGVLTDPSTLNMSSAKAGTYVVLEGSFAASGNDVKSLGTPVAEGIVAGDSRGIVIKLAPGTGTAKFQVVNSNGASNIVSIPVM